MTRLPREKILSGDGIAPVTLTAMTAITVVLCFKSERDWTNCKERLQTACYLAQPCYHHFGHVCFEQHSSAVRIVRRAIGCPFQASALGVCFSINIPNIASAPVHCLFLFQVTGWSRSRTDTWNAAVIVLFLSLLHAILMASIWDGAHGVRTCAVLCFFHLLTKAMICNIQCIWCRPLSVHKRPSRIT